MILRPRVLEERLRRLRSVIRNLREIQGTPKDEFVGSFRQYWLAERGLQLAAETLFDIGNHLLAGHFNVHPGNYEDVIEQLANQGVVTADLRERLRGLGGFRNILVHEYLEVDLERVHEFLQNGLNDFSDFADQVEAFLAKQS